MSDEGRKKRPRIRRVLLGALVLYLGGSYVTARVHRIDSLPGDPAATIPAGSSHTASGVIHVHTNRSHDAIGTDAEVAEAASDTGLDFVFVTDHRPEEAAPSDWSRWAAREDGVLLVRGQEIRVRDMGYVLVDRLDTAVVSWNGGVESFIRQVERDDAFAIVAHPRSPRGNREAWQLSHVTGMDAWETFDWVDQARRRLASATVGYHLAALIGSYPLGLGGGAASRLYREGFDVPGAAAWDSMTTREAIAAVGGLDMHPKARLPWGSLLPAYQPFFRSMVNHVALDEPLDGGDPEAGARRLTDAIEAGRVHISFEGAEAARAFRWGLGTGERPATATMEPTSLVPGLRLEAGFEVDPGRILYRVLRDGREVGWRDGPRLAWRTDTVGSYRVEVYRYTLRLGPFLWNLRPWIFSNPVPVVRGVGSGS